MTRLLPLQCPPAIGYIDIAAIVQDGICPLVILALALHKHPFVFPQGAFYILGEQLALYLHRNRDMLTLMSVEDAMVGIWLLGVEKVRYATVRYDAVPRFVESVRGAVCRRTSAVYTTTRSQAIHVDELLNTLPIHRYGFFLVSWSRSLCKCSTTV